MFLVENITPHPPHDHEDCAEERAEYSRAIAEDRVPMLPKPDAEHDHKCASHAAAHGLSATLGLVIHGAADGIAIGASSLSGSAQLGLVVFLAVLVHKGPAALGLTTTLLNLHLTPAQVRRRLVIFSLSAPLGALLTYALVLLFGKGSSTSGHDRLGWWTGVVLLFSGGSFLYVATVIQPISQTGPDDHCHDIHHEVHKREEPPPLPYGMRTGLILGGMLLPLLLSLLVGSHDHGSP
ncbi:hypothetical protein VHUM_01497 [Vanrija humicola]|uniref:Uncharacterized protein n=1 Tax=Vanrija humicola TaxID=5417 RepID=A0A7D8Z845_VANHU|nr:hypothetical protein VHUM_01497 [Vanrija humicola]